MELIKQLWRGEIPLVKTYWLFGFVGNFLLQIPFVVWAVSEQVPSIGLMWLYFGVTVIYSLIVLIGIWRSATKYYVDCSIQGIEHKKKKRIWAILAKISVVLGFLRTLQTILENLAPLF